MTEQNQESATNTGKFSPLEKLSYYGKCAAIGAAVPVVGLATMFAQVSLQGIAAVRGEKYETPILDALAGGAVGTIRRKVVNRENLHSSYFGPLHMMSVGMDDRATAEQRKICDKVEQSATALSGTAIALGVVSASAPTAVFMAVSIGAPTSFFGSMLGQTHYKSLPNDQGWPDMPNVQELDTKPYDIKPAYNKPPYNIKPPSLSP